MTFAWIVSVPCRGCWFQMWYLKSNRRTQWKEFPSPVGDVGFKYIHIMHKTKDIIQFPSPVGDVGFKFSDYEYVKPRGSYVSVPCRGCWFQILQMAVHEDLVVLGFRPLSGMLVSNAELSTFFPMDSHRFRPLSGMLVSNQLYAEQQARIQAVSFRPLSGMLVSNISGGNFREGRRHVSVPCRGCWFQIFLMPGAASFCSLLFPSPVGDVGFKLPRLLCRCRQSQDDVSVPCRGCWFQIEWYRRQNKNRILQKFPSPVGDVGFKSPRRTYLCNSKNCHVSVPCRGCWFQILYNLHVFGIFGAMRFRPLSGMLVSNYGECGHVSIHWKQFPSPVGDVGFKSKPGRPTIPMHNKVSVPCRGCWFQIRNHLA